jgi:hypothetical protein
MPIGTDVRLPKAYPALFPDRCIACGRDHPDALYRVRANASALTLAYWGLGSRLTVEAPVCERCRKRTRRRRWALVVVYALLLSVGILLWLVLTHGSKGPGRTWIGLGIILLCLLPGFVWEFFRPTALEITANPDTVDYQFRDPDYAIDFYLLNEPGDGQLRTISFGSEPSPGHQTRFLLSQHTSSDPT